MSMKQNFSCYCLRKRGERGSLNVYVYCLSKVHGGGGQNSQNPHPVYVVQPQKISAHVLLLGSRE